MDSRTAYQVYLTQLLVTDLEDMIDIDVLSYEDFLIKYNLDK